MRTVKTSELRGMGIIFNSFNVSSPSPAHYREKIDGRNGFIDLGTTYDGRTIDAKITILPVDSQDYALLRDDVFSLFDSREPFYLIHEDIGKQWIVKYNSPYSFKRSANIGEATIKFVSSNAYSESIGTTLDDFTFDAEIWGIGQGLEAEDLQYVHTTNKFSIFNAGEKIDPRELPLKIHFTGASSNLAITNSTNGTEWKYNASTVGTDIILLDGIRSFKNGISIFKDTNYAVIELEKGWNDFTINGATDPFEIKFEFRFYDL